MNSEERFSSETPMTGLSRRRLFPATTASVATDDGGGHNGHRALHCGSEERFHIDVGELRFLAAVEPNCAHDDNALMICW